jgi:hypothetical protein
MRSHRRTLPFTARNHAIVLVLSVLNQPRRPWRCAPEGLQSDGPEGVPSLTCATFHGRPRHLLRHTPLLVPPRMTQVSELEGRAHDVQMLKFGQVIDLELLDKVSSSRGTEDLKEELRKQVRGTRRRC